MDAIQKQYHAFIESVCTKYGCKDAAPVLQKGFSALCESEWAEETYRAAHQSEDPELCGEPDPVVLGSDSKPVEYCKECGQPMYRYGYLDSDGLCPECRGFSAPDYELEGTKCSHCGCEEGSDWDFGTFRKGLCPDCYRLFHPANEA